MTRVVEHPAWPVLKDAVERIRPWQSKDGSIDFDAEGAPGAGVHASSSGSAASRPALVASVRNTLRRVTR